MLRRKPAVERDETFEAHIFRSLKARYEEERVGITLRICSGLGRRFSGRFRAQEYRSGMLSSSLWEPARGKSPRS